MKKGKFSIRQRLRSFRFAWNGLRHLFNYEHNAWIHLAALIIVAFAGFFFSVSSTEWISIALAAALVFVTEIINTAIERLCDVVKPTRHREIGRIKDLAAAAVLISAVASVAVAGIVFIPKIIAYSLQC